MGEHGERIAEVRGLIERGDCGQALAQLESIPEEERAETPGWRELCLECLGELGDWKRGRELADTLLHDRLGAASVAKFRCAYARHRGRLGDRKGALWELSVALQTDESIREKILEDDDLKDLLLPG